MPYLKNILSLVSCLFYAVVSCCPITGYSADSNQAQLRSIQQDIAAKEKQVKAKKAQRSELLGRLESQEKLIAQVSRKLRNIRQQLQQINDNIASLTSTITQLQQQQQQQEHLLARQLDTAFRIGQHNGLEMLFTAEQAQRSDRILSYFRYLNSSRQQNIDSIKQTRQQISDKKSLLEQRRQQQTALQQQQQQQKNSLEQTRTDRQQTLVTLESTLQKDQAALSEMRQNESRLRTRIAQAEQRAKAQAEREAREAEQIKQRQAQAKAKGNNYQPTAGETALISRTGGLGRSAGKYTWPVQGTVLHRFGENLQGELRWKGLVINAAEGSEVKAIANGRVLMADWLQGYGLVVVIEHGKGDMSLYGYNQSALVNVGDQVTAGQPIALVGSSGGQGTPSLYFEIRRQGQALDPLRWLKR